MLVRLVLVFSLVFFSVRAQSPSNMEEDVPSKNDFHPSLAIVLGVLTVMFLLTLILIIFVKCCHNPTSFVPHSNTMQLIRSSSRFSGIDRTVVESLPFFKFSSLKGSREGLECCVCLSKFEDSEILRLLPKCKHGFHISCVDKWLEKHSSCPLCRQKISATDENDLAYSRSFREMDGNLEIFIQREEFHRGSSRFSDGSSFRKFEEELPIEEINQNDENAPDLHKFNHKIIIVSDAILKNRWSNVSSSDLMFLNSEMLNEMSSNRFSALEGSNNGEIVKIEDEMERKKGYENNFNQSDLIPYSGIHAIATTSKVLNPTNEKRSMSEIIVHPRFKEFSMKYSGKAENNVREERRRSVWLQIARRTVQWFANRERRPTQSNTIQSLNV